MRLKRILLSLTAFVLALSSALPAGAEAFTIPAGNTKSCKKNEAPVNAWWPNGGNSSGDEKNKTVDLAALNGNLWIIAQSGENNANAAHSVKIVNGATFNLIRNANTTGVSGGTYGIIRHIRRMGNDIVAVNAPGSRKEALKIYKWSSETSVPSVILDVTMENKFADDSKYDPGRAFGVWGNMTNGKFYILSLDRKSVFVFTVTNGSVNSTPQILTINGDLPLSDIGYIEPVSGTEFWLTTNQTYGIKYVISGNNATSTSTKFTYVGIGAPNGIGQRHFTFKGRSLALCMNMCKDETDLSNSGAIWTRPKLTLVDYTAGVGAQQKNIIEGTPTVLSTHSQGFYGRSFTGCDYEIKTADKHLV